MMNKAVILAAGAGTRMQQKDATAIETDKQKAIAATGIKAFSVIWQTLASGKSVW